LTEASIRPDGTTVYEFERIKNEKIMDAEIIETATSVEKLASL